MATGHKDTIYIDIDDEITAIIDKVRSSEQKIVALVLPKRSAVLQSIVNMKLLKRSADADKKHVVLITSEAGLLPLAGAVGMHVAPSLQSRPAIPAPPEGMNMAADAGYDDHDFDADAVADKPIGQLAGPAAFARPSDELETIELDDDTPEEPAAAPLSRSAGNPLFGAAAAGATAGAGNAAKVKKDKKLHIPDFNKFRLGLVLGGVALIGLLIFGYLALFVLPKATVTLATDSSDITTNANITLDPTTEQLDLEDRIFPAKIETVQQTGSQQTSTTGQKNKGEKAGGSVMVSQTCTRKPAPIDSGTGFSSGGQTFISTSATELSPSGVDSDGNFICKGEADVVAQQPGAKYNLPAGSKFMVAGYSGASGVNGDAFSGGTDNIVKVVSQSDIDTAKQKITSQDANSVKADLKLKLQNADFYPIESTAHAGETKVTSSANAGDEADTVSVTSTTPHTMYGIKRADIEKFVTENVEDKIDPSKQQILDKGLRKASYDVATPAGSGALRVSFSATALAGPDVNTEALKKQIAGKKTNDVRTIATATPGVTNVRVDYSPFWVSKVPKKENKITVVIEKAPASTDASR
ncbi:MAG TPA: hypothetical protein VK978_03245 [Candidatus Saccharimonadales bacterium]|nr:hypothetical protein [Candidatus Saccharimonadales bacterium]